MGGDTFTLAFISKKALQPFTLYKVPNGAQKAWVLFPISLRDADHCWFVFGVLPICDQKPVHLSSVRRKQFRMVAVSGRSRVVSPA